MRRSKPNTRRGITIRTAIGMMVCLICLQGCKHQNQEGNAKLDELHRTIQNPETPEADLLQALRKLGEPTETAAYWAAIANDARVSALHRNHAIFQLFLRHVPQDLTFAEWAAILGETNWTKHAELTKVFDIGGRMPVEVNSGEAIFILVLQGIEPPETGKWSIYLRVSEDISPDEMGQFFAGDMPAARAETLRLKEYALHPVVPVPTAQN